MRSRKIIQGHSGQGKKYRLYFKRNGKSLDDFKQRNNMIWNHKMTPTAAL